MSRIRRWLSASRQASHDRRRYQRHFRADAAGAAPKVLSWVAAQPRRELFTTSINQAEILFGIEAWADGKRRGLAAAAEAMFAEDFADRILAFDTRAAAHYARLVTERSRAGKPIEAFDALIAATALAAGADVATRDIGGFAGCGLKLINPWDER